jgi:uridine phosphorylase
MGGPSISILLNEVAKLLKYAKADAYWIRMGTCGGIDVAPGTVVISSESLNGALEPFHETIVLGRKVQREAKFDTQLVGDLEDTARDLKI